MCWEPLAPPMALLWGTHRYPDTITRPDLVKWAARYFSRPARRVRWARGHRQWLQANSGRVKWAETCPCLPMHAFTAASVLAPNLPSTGSAAYVHASWK